MNVDAILLTVASIAPPDSTATVHNEQLQLYKQRQPILPQLLPHWVRSDARRLPDVRVHACIEHALVHIEHQINNKWHHRPLHVLVYGAPPICIAILQFTKQFA